MRLISKKSVLRSRQTDTFNFAWNVWMYFSYYNTLQEEDFAEHVWCLNYCQTNISESNYDFMLPFLKGIIFYHLYE